jgi:uncharacterized protein (TIGR02001 family)
MKKLFLMVGLLVSLPSFASVSANVGITSDYIWRGMTQSDGISVSGGFDYSADNGFYAGVWGANINWGYITDDNDVLTDYGSGNEFDVYFGYATEVNGIGVDLGYVAFKYPGVSAYDFEEVVLGLSKGDFGFTYANATTDGFTDYLEVSYALGPIAFAYGSYDDMGDNLLISYGFSCGSYDCGFAYSDFSADTDADGEFFYGPDEDAFVFSISASL